ncbi:MAG: hypothetical protein NWE76_01440 [Candidatus Bathyarchaeota archaeon]|nr:hypothetical protein [Candidatus Bathyarchaeota archaeon]
MLTQLTASVALGCYILFPNLCLKDGVHINGAHFDPVMVRIIDVARETAPMLERGTVWITSANDSEHMTGSLHYANRAFDIRIRNIVGNVQDEARLWVERMQVELGDDYDVLLETDHIHVEYDPEETNPHEIPDGFNMRID